MSFNEFTTNPKTLIAFFIIFGVVAVLMGICKLVSFLRERNYKDFPCGNETDTDFIDQELKELNEIKMKQARLKLRKNND